MKTIKFKYYQILRIFSRKIPKHIVLEYAKNHYLTTPFPLGMCSSIEMACSYFYISPISVYYFTKFNPRFCEADDPTRHYKLFWWDIENKNSRIKAFDKLIKYYKEHKEYI